MFEQYSDRAMRIVFIARLKAGRDGASTLDLPHLLASVLIEDQGGQLGKELTGIPINGDHVTTSRSRTSQVHKPFFLFTTARRLLRQLEKQPLRRPPIPPTPDLPLSPAAKSVLQAATWLKERFEQQEVTPLHLLAAALLRDGASAALFREAGVTAETVLEFVRSQTQEQH
ncbi:MAG TPA: Clp protease N-terminal domain-containing protein [Candidatus Angelobacter sp.]